jgi:ubiquinone/menaquinone biosynthesis C-methylase UbiE
MFEQNEEKAIQQWGKYADLFDKNMGEDGDTFHTTIIDPALLAAIPESIEGMRILDAGCGNGHFCRHLAKSGAKEVIGVDISQEMIELAQARGTLPNLQYRHADLMQELPFRNSEFDVAVGSMLAQYVPSIDKLADNLGRVLKPNGYLLLSIDHPSHALLMRILQLVGYPDPKFIDSAPYFKTAFCRKKSLWDQAILGYYHRPLQDYITPFLTRRWALLHFAEEGRSTKLPSQDAQEEIIPRVVILGFTSPNC